MKIYTHLSIAVAIIYLLAQVSVCEDLRNSKFLLPGNLIPTHYDVTFEFLDNCTDGATRVHFDERYFGNVGITLTAIEPNVTAIELNCFRLNITKAIILIEGGSEYFELRTSECDKVTRKVTLYSPFGLPISKTLVLCVTFVGKIAKFYDRGIYAQLEFKDPEMPDTSEVIESIGTLFEPAAARQAFPCFDEPKYKTTYKLNLNVSTCILKNGYVALSNAPLEVVEQWDDRSLVYFKNTDFIMSTYLFAFAICPYKSTAVKLFNSSFPNVNGTELKEVRTWGPPHVVEGWIGYVAQEVGARFLELFSRHLNIGYPLKKMDQVFILSNYIICGMENWGVISYSSSVTRNYTLVNLLGHEIAHQWFGNLLTCHWWSDIWLNEGFASYFSYYGIDKLNTENIIPCSWDPKLSFIRERLLQALDKDKGTENRALTTPVDNPSSYNDVFTVIPYSKGASVIRMWSHILGEKVFMKAIRKFLSDNKFGLATPKLLFEIFDSVAHESASSFENGSPSKYFRNWHMEAGFPLVEVKKSTKNSSVYILTQRVFGNKDSKKVKWTIPITYSTNINQDFDKTHVMLWFREEDNEAKIVLPSPVNWIIVNNQFTGFYRVKYEQENYENLAQHMISVENHRDIHEANRIQIISDAFALVQTCDAPDEHSKFFMDLSLYLKHETAYLPWKSALDYAIDYLNTMLGKNDAIYQFFKIYVIDLLQDNYSKLTFNVKPSDSYNDKQLREELVEWACKMDHPDCIRQSYYFVNKFSIRSQIHNKVYDTALCTSIRRQTDNDWDILWESYLSTTNFEERNIILNAIGCSRDSNILTRFLIKSLDETLTINEDERKSFFIAVLNGDSQNVDIAFDFFCENYLPINEMYGGYHPVSDLLLLLSKKLGTDEEVKKMKRITVVLEGEKKVKLKENAIREAMERCMSNNNWIKTKSKEVNVWLLSHYG